MNIRMFPQRLLVKQEDDLKTTQGGLFVPETISKTIARGTVVSVDEGKLRVGDTILFDNRQALPINLEGVEYVILHESQIFGVLNQKKPRKPAK